MACPRCGSNSQRQIAPNYVECIGVIVVPTGRHPSGIQGPPEEQVICGFKFHTAASIQDSTPTCSCGTFAIGRCSGCESPVCGDHSSITDRGRLCENCLTATRESATAERVEREAALRAKLRDEALSLINAGLPGDPYSPRKTHRRKDADWTPAADTVSEGDDCPFHGMPCKVVGVGNGTGLARLRRDYVVCGIAGWCISSYAGSDRAILLANGTISYKWWGEIPLDDLDGEKFADALRDMSFHTGGSTKKLEEMISTLGELRATT